MTDNEIIKMIQNAIASTDFKIMSFNRNHECFGNMDLIIANNKQKLEYITDRGDVFCNSKLVVMHGYHVAGEDETPLHLIQAIKDSIKKL
jgi:hypothetical protein